jgi:hypothetical protein
MSYRDAITLALRGVLRRPGRAALTVSAVALAAALLVALLVIARTAETRVLGQLSKGGPLAGIRVAAAAPDAGSLDSDQLETGASRDLGDDVVRRIQALPDVRSVVRILSVPAIVSADEPLELADGSEAHLRTRRRDPDGVLLETFVGADLRLAAQLPLTVLAGRLPSVGSRTEVAVTPAHLERFDLTKDDAAKILGTELVIGAPRLDRLGGSVVNRVRWTRVTVVGVIAQEAADGELLGAIEQTQPAQAWTNAGQPFDRGRDIQTSSSPYTGLFVVARGLDQVGPVRAAIDGIGYATSAPENLLASVQRYLRVVEIVLAGIGLIALLIASLGITNALLAAVRERRREIGVLKAIGARDRDVLRVFLLEAGMLGMIGGAVGTLLGLAIAATVGSVVNGYLTSQGLVGIHVGVPTSIVAGSVLGATVLAVLAGAIPAWRAARLPAREAVDA